MKINIQHRLTCSPKWSEFTWNLRSLVERCRLSQLASQSFPHIRRFYALCCLQNHRRGLYQPKLVVHLNRRSGDRPISRFVPISKHTGPPVCSSRLRTIMHFRVKLLSVGHSCHLALDLERPGTVLMGPTRCLGCSSPPLARHSTYITEKK